jgi:hypothetical protein
MMRTNIALALLVWTALSVSQTQANSTPAQSLTPANVDDQPHRILIQAEDVGHEIRFYVRVAAGEDTPLEVEWGYLMVMDGDKPVTRGRLYEERQEEAVHFEFAVARKFLERSTFSFLAATATPEEREDLPSGGGWRNYQFLLKDFVHNPQAEKKQLQALLALLEEKGIDLQPVRKKSGESGIDHWFTIGPDHTKKHYVGLNYLPPRTPSQIAESTRGFGLPSEIHGDWLILQIGGPGGNGAEDYVAAYKKVLACLKEFAQRTDSP